MHYGVTMVVPVQILISQSMTVVKEQLELRTYTIRWYVLNNSVMTVCR